MARRVWRLWERAVYSQTDLLQQECSDSLCLQRSEVGRRRCKALLGSVQEHAMMEQKKQDGGLLQAWPHRLAETPRQVVSRVNCR